jgi:epsilon-lactone hydrolase
MASSKQADFLRALYQHWTDRMVADPNLSIANLRSMFDEWGQPALEPENVCTRVIASAVLRLSGRSL